MMTYIDNWLNSVTMYRLLVYVLCFYLAAAMVLGTLGLLPFLPWLLALSVAYILAISVLVHAIFVKVFGATPNVESVYITALILALIISPMRSFGDGLFYSIAGWAAVWAVASKYIFAIDRKHLFNPAAVAVVITTLFLGQSASWWIGTAILLPFTAIGGFLIVRKIRRFDLIAAFFAVSVTAVLAPHIVSGSGILTSLRQIIINSPLIFFATVMLTEPITAPRRSNQRTIYAALVGFMFAPAFHVGSLYFTPELALICGNLFAYLVSPKFKLMPSLRAKVKAAGDAVDFIFVPDRSFRFLPGQYLEVTLPLENSDARGNRRYFTIASSPTESELRFGIKFYPEPSKFKQKLIALLPGERIVASELSGDFVMPKDRNIPLVFLAGGIGVTPFRSMIKYVMDRHEKRDITLLYTNRNERDIAYKSLFDEARKAGIKVVYFLTDRKNIRPDWPGEKQRIDAETILKYVPRLDQSLIYISGQQNMIKALEGELLTLGVLKKQIKKDYFSGLA